MTARRPLRAASARASSASARSFSATIAARVRSASAGTSSSVSPAVSIGALNFTFTVTGPPGVLRTRLDVPVTVLVPTTLVVEPSRAARGGTATVGGTLLDDQNLPVPGATVRLDVIDVAGTDEAELELEGTGNPGRDSETLSIVDVNLSTLSTLGLPTYRIVHRREWTGENHVNVFGQHKALADIWNPLYVVIDATGVGEGQFSLWRKSFPSERVIPVKFTQQKKLPPKRKKSERIPKSNKTHLSSPRHRPFTGIFAIVTFSQFRACRC